MGKPGTKRASRRVQVRLGAELADQVHALSQRWGVPESAVGSVLIAAGLARLTQVMNEPFSPAELAGAIREATPEADALEDRPGFRPGGKPRADGELVTASSTPARGDEWSGYMRGL